MGIFYVYEHWRPDKNVCFYVGKGKGQRAYKTSRNADYNRVVRGLSKLGMCVEIRLICNGISETKAHNIERARIIFWRKRHNWLTDRAAGGQGSAGWKHTAEWKLANGKRMRGRKDSPAVRKRKKLAALKRPPSIKSVRKKISVTVKTLWADPGYRASMVAAHKGKRASKAACAKMKASQRARRAHTKVSAVTRARAAASMKEWHRQAGHIIS